MQIDLKELEETINAVKNNPPAENLSQKIFSLMDLTSLNETDSEESIAALCQKAITPKAHVAAVCVFPEFVKHAKKMLAGSVVKIATVANFPHGVDALDDVLKSIRQSIKNGAQEIDVVFPFADYLNGDREAARQFIAACKAVCGDLILLKVILETGALHDAQMIADASEDVITAGADFLKTSTGKITIGATLEAACIMLMTIKQLKPTVGFKASGGIRTHEQASQYIDLAERIMGKEWVNPRTFRLGASRIVS